MSRKKQLKVRGSSISSVIAQTQKARSENQDGFITVVVLEIVADNVGYKYEIRKDEKAPDMNKTRDFIEASLTKARAEFLNVEISEYSERMYLTLKIQGMDSQQYTGYRI